MHTISQTLADQIDRIDGLAAVRDKDCVYQYTNAIYGRLHGLHHHLDIVGGTSLDLPCDTAACAAVFDEQDRQVMRTGKVLKILDIHRYADDEWRAHLYTKRPWLDDQQSVIGTIGWGVDITRAYTYAFGHQLARYSDQPDFVMTDGEDQVDGISLSPRESEVLFLVLRGKTSKLAAAALGLSYRTVEQYVETLKLKFGVQSKIELIDAAIGRGYMQRIPLSIFSKQLSVVLAVD